MKIQKIKWVVLTDSRDHVKSHFLSIIMKNSLPTLFATAAAAGIMCLSMNSASASVVAHWEFESAPGGSTADSSGNGHSGTLIGTASIVSDATRGNVLSLNGFVASPAGVDIDSTLAIPTLAANGGMSFAAWIKRAAGTDADYLGYVIALGASGDAPVATLGIHTTDFVSGFVEGDGADTQVNVNGNTAVIDDVWSLPPPTGIKFMRVRTEP